MSDRPSTPWSGHTPAKDQVREEIWNLLIQKGVVLRNPIGHIPNFVGAEQAANRLATLPIWNQAQTVKCNPDAPQRFVRLRALEAGKRLYMAVPRLTNRCCFVELTAADLQARGISLEEASYARKALMFGKFLTFEEMLPIDLVVVGCVSASRQGGRTGKGAGFADLELAMLRLFGLVQETTPIVTTVHSLQVVDGDKLPMLSHDWSLTWVVTPEEAIAIPLDRPQPTGIDWNIVRPEQYKTIPVLQQIRERFDPSEDGRGLSSSSPI